MKKILIHPAGSITTGINTKGVRNQPIFRKIIIKN